MSNAPVSLAGKVLVVGGSTGHLGRAVVEHALNQGARVAMPVRKPWQVDKVRAQFAGKPVLVGCVPDVDGEAAAGFMKGANDALGPIDALLCCNGAFAFGAIGKDPAGELGELLTANLLSVANLARAAIGPMRRRKQGSIVCVGSAMVGKGGPGTANYLASKAALHEWVRALAVELEGSGVRARAVLPSTIDTPANRAAMPDQDPSLWLPLALVVDAVFAAAFAPSAAGPLLEVARALR